MDIDVLAKHPAVALYFKYIDNTETPKIMHLWSFLSGISACMGRRCWLPMGTGDVFPNMFVIMSGPPALRKSTAFRIMTGILTRCTNVKLAPDDTSGQRQGLIAAMTHVSDDDNKDTDEVLKALSKANSRAENNGMNISLADLSGELDAIGELKIDTRDPHTMFIAASELNSILGEGNTALLTFLQKMYDGDPYRYQLKSTSYELSNALLGLIGATTPSQLAIALPAEAIGQGFTSRAIFVYADKKHARKIPRPTLDKEAEQQIEEIFSHVFNTFAGPFKESPAAAEALDAVYVRGTDISDPRFVHYLDRRHTHLQKLAMIFAATRKSMTIEVDDVIIADKVLMYTEQFMSDALGEYGMSKLSAAKQQLMDYVSSITEPVPMTILYSFMSRNMTQLEFKNTIVELHNAGKITQTTLPALGQCIIATGKTSGPMRKAKTELNSLEALMVAKRA